jgi:pyruvate,orthophosphate dikinase
LASPDLLPQDDEATGGAAAAGLLVVSFDDRLDPGVDLPSLLGGKGAGLVEMTQGLGLPVPPGFVITTAICREYLASGWSEALDRQLDEHLGGLAERTGRRFGDADAPLLVSVRSGAPVSMPGMMDTVLNVGMTAAVHDRLAAESGDPRFAADTWLRFCMMYAEIVLCVPPGEVDAAAASDGSAAGKRAAAERVRHLAAGCAPPGIPAEPRAQLRGAIEAVFRSWHSDRARVFRAREGISESLGTAVVVQAMVFGNLDDRSGTGVAFTRNPATGDPAPYGDYLPRAQGEDVVAGTHSVAGLEALHQQLPEVHGQLLDVLRGLELHYRDVCDVEFTVSAGQLYVLQTRIARRSPLAAIRIAVDMAEDPEFPLTRSEAVARVGEDVLRHQAESVTVAPAAVPVGRGLPASPGVGTGILSCDPDEAEELSRAGTAVVLAREDTSPADVHGMVGAAALVTTVGGVASHAAVVARGWGIPAITSLAAATVSDAGLTVGDTLLRLGELVTVDGGTGLLYRGDQRAARDGEDAEVRKLRQWAAEAEESATPAPTPAAAAPLREVGLYEFARALQLKGLAQLDRLAAVLHTAEPDLEALIAGSPAMFKATPRGFALTPEGRAWVTEQLEQERDAADRQALEAAYERFLALNHSFKALVSGWQLANGNEDAWPPLVDGLAGVHGGLLPLLLETAQVVSRLSHYAPRFESALDQVRAGDTTMLASPVKDSYHTVWFEYHEELIALCGRDRLTEERLHPE